MEISEVRRAVYLTVRHSSVEMFFYILPEVYVFRYVQINLTTCW
jgi:hypothetical protein